MLRLFRVKVVLVAHPNQLFKFPKPSFCIASKSALLIWEISVVLLSGSRLLHAFHEVHHPYAPFVVSGLTVITGV